MIELPKEVLENPHNYCCYALANYIKSQPKITLNDTLDELIARMEKSKDAQNVPYEDDYRSFLDGVDKCIEIIESYKFVREYEYKKKLRDDSELAKEKEMEE